MIVVRVLMISCQVLMLWMTAMDGAQITTSSTQNAKNHARLTNLDAAVANRSNQPTCSLTSAGISASLWRVDFDAVGLDPVDLDPVDLDGADLPRVAFDWLDLDGVDFDCVEFDLVAMAVLLSR